MSGYSPRTEIETALSGEVNGVLNATFFNFLREGLYNSRQIQQFAEQYYAASLAFPQMLALAAAHMGNDRDRAALVSNLWDEHGRGDIARSHRSVLLKFVAAAGSGLKVDEDFKPTAATYCYIISMKALCSDSNPRFILGALGPGCEAYTPDEYTIIVNALEEHYHFANAALEFFIDHANHDEGHLSDLYRAIAPAGHMGKAAISDVIFGAKLAIRLEKNFWDGMHAEMIEIP